MRGHACTPKKLGGWGFTPTKNLVWGFTIIELLLVVSIISILAVLTASVGSGFLVRNATKNALQQLVSDLRIAELNSISGKGDSDWGVKVGSNQIVLFKGSSYSAREQSLDEVFSVGSAISVGDAEFVFQNLTGNSTPAQVIINNNLGESISVSVNEVGSVDVN